MVTTPPRTLVLKFIHRFMIISLLLLQCTPPALLAAPLPTPATQEPPPATAETPTIPTNSTKRQPG